MINNKKSPILDKEIKEYLKTKELNLTSTKDKLKAFKDAEYIIIATPTDYDPKKIFQHKKCRKCNNRCAGNKLRNNNDKKSTIPVGQTKEIIEKFNTKNKIFSPEFLREGQKLYDKLYPFRIVIGEQSKRAKKICRTITRTSSYKRKNTNTIHRFNKSRSDKTLRKHIPCNEGSFL